MKNAEEVKTFNILKKDRKYFAATLNNCKCKILIDAASESLKPGPDQMLKVIDLSVRSKYGTDLLFKLAAEATQQQESGVCSLRHARYNSLLIEDCRRLGGKWDADSKAWLFSGMVASEVETLDDLYNGQTATYEVEFTREEEALCRPVRILGYSVATARGRDSGAKLGEGIAVITGNFTSGGSMKNWTTTVAKGTVIRMQMPIALVEARQTKQGQSVKKLTTTIESPASVS